MNAKLSLVFSLTLGAAMSLSAGPLMEVRNTEGRALKIDLLELAGDTVVFKTIGELGGKEHSLPIAKFDDASQAEIRLEALDLKPRLPPVDIDVVVARKRDKVGYYMINQSVTAKVKIRNLSTRLAFPKSKAHLTYFGRDRRDPELYKVMARKSFDCELAANASFAEDVAGFKTSYDSDNKGVGNIGGFQYDGYLLVLTNDAGEVLATKTSDAGVRAAIEKDLSKAKALTDVAVTAVLDKNLDVRKGAGE